MTCDIVIPIYNQLKYTKVCLESLKKNTRYPYSITIVDDASDKETQEYLNGLNKKQEIILFRNKSNLGWLKSANKGMSHAKAKYICLMNNDTLATDGWLGEMINIAEKEEGIGLVNPSSNTLGDIPKRNETLDAYSVKLEFFKDQYRELNNCFGFCMLIKREVIEKIGYFDEVFSPGYWEESDYCRRAYRAGYRSVCAKGAYVYHYEKISFGKSNSRVEELKSKNWEIYQQRYNPLRIAVIVDILVNRTNLSKNLLILARQGNIVYVFMKGGIAIDVKEHSNVRIFHYPIFFTLFALLKILNRNKKKDYDLIITFSESFKKFLLRFSFLRKYKIYSSIEMAVGMN